MVTGSPAHPRSRGENVITRRPLPATTGSSPLTRGKPVTGIEIDTTEGLIPAHAGKTSTICAIAFWKAAHPRSRGENFMCSAGLPRMNGSSPLTRGKHRPYWTPARRKGLIPAHAGKTGRGARAGGGHWAHPRSRGENAVGGCPARAAAGSSPLTRGKRPGTRSACGPIWLIPAHAGKTDSVPRRANRARAHPRSRGENGELVGVLGLDRWLIPAHAGKTSPLGGPA